MSRMHIIPWMAVSLLIFSACEEVQGPPGGISNGSLSGFVKLYDEYGSLAGDKQGATVTIVGSDPEVSATTGSDGRYQIDNLQTGVYNLKFSKVGYGTYIYKFRFVGGPADDYLYTQVMVQVSTTQITDLDVYPDPEFNDVWIDCKVDPDPSPNLPINIRFFISESENVSADNYTSTFREDFDYAYEDILGNEQGQILFYSFNIWDALEQYTPGTTVYIVAYGCARYQDDYTNMDGHDIFPSMNPLGSNIDSFTIPD